MALGYCPECEKLVPIEPKEHKRNGTRQRWWKPVAHLQPDGTPCPNARRI